MALDLKTLADAESIVTGRTGLAAADLVDLDLQLDLSAATYTDDDGNGQTAYRPYYVAARYLASALHTRKLLSGEGASFASPSLTIDSLMREQAAFDADYADQYDDYAVPKGYEAWEGSTLEAVF